jgi:hypothetical protein
MARLKKAFFLRVNEVSVFGALSKPANSVERWKPRVYI